MGGAIRWRTSQHLPNLELLDLAARGRGQFGQSDYSLGQIMLRKTLCKQVADQRRDGHRRCVFGRDHGSADPPTQPLVGDPDHRDIEDVKMVEDDRLDVGDRDILATADDDVVASATDRQPATLIDAGAISGADPQSPKISGVGRMGIVGITQQSRRSPD
jgi:hypothetical protein